MSAENGSVKVENGANGSTTEDTTPKKEVVDGKVVSKQEDCGPAAKKVKVEVDEAVKDKVLQQMEFYFGDVNLPRDTFMKSEMAKGEGWIELETMMKFNRLKDLLSKYEPDEFNSIVLEALERSVLIEVDSEGKKLRRSAEFPAPEGTGEEKTVYVKNFARTETTLDELLEHFKKNYEGVEAVILRHYNRKVLEGGEIQFKREFKGSVFVVFKTEAQAQALMDEPNTTYKGVELIKMKQKDYKQKKIEDLQARIEARKKKKDSQEEPEEPSEEREPPKLGDNIFLKIRDVPEGLSREDIKESWASIFKGKEGLQIVFIDFNRGEKDAVIRLEKDNASKDALEELSKTDNPGKIALGKENELRDVVELDEEEVKKQVEMIAQKSLMRGKRPGGGRGGRRGGRGGRGGGRGGFKRRRRD